MRVAIPLFGERVAPRFECASSALVADVDSTGVHGRQTYPLVGLPVPAKLQLLRSLGVEVLVCGGMSGFYARRLQRGGVRLYTNVMGTAEAALNELAAGNLRQGWREPGGPRRFRGGRPRQGPGFGFGGRA